MTDFDQYVQKQADQQAHRPDSADKQPLDFAPFESALAALTPERAAELESFILKASLIQLQAHLTAGTITSVELVTYFLARILGHQPYNTFLELNPDALTIASQTDAERAAGQVRGALHGIPVALKGNIATGDQMTTTAGARVLLGCHADRDAFLVTALREAGAVILGKTNLSEWANFYAHDSINGYSTLGGHTRHPLGAFDVGGSSSGACAALALGLIPASVGSETTGSIVYPASQNGVVGLKPSIGLISRDHIIPITDAFDTAGPIGRTVADVAALMTILATGADGNDPATASANGVFGTDFTAGLRLDALNGVRVGLVKRENDYRDGDDLIRAEIVRRLTAAGALVVDVPPMEESIGKERDDQLGKDSLQVMILGFRLGLEAYLTGQGGRVPVQRLAEIVAFNQLDAANRVPSGQELIVAAAEATPEALAGYSALAAGVVSAYAVAVRGALTAHKLSILADFSNYASPYHSRAGFPAITHPAGLRPSGEPLGITFFGEAFTDAQLLSYAFAFEAQA